MEDASDKRPLDAKESGARKNALSSNKAPEEQEKSTFRKLLQLVVNNFVILSAVAGGIYAFARLEERVEQQKVRLEERVEQQKVRIEQLEREIQKCTEGHPALRHDVEMTRVSIEIIKCDLSNLAFDPVSLKCTSAPRSSSVRQSLEP